MRFNFKKVSALATSALMAGMTIGMAAAASFPAPFVQNGASDVGIVVGSGEGVSMLDSVQSARMLDNFLRDQLGTTDSDTSSTVVGGDAASLASGSKELYLNDDLSENVQTLTDQDLATVLASGTFTNDDGTDYDFDQKITLGTSTSNGLAFGNSDNDLDDPAVMLELYSGSTVSSNYAYQWTVTFNEAVNFSATASEGEEISIFGKTYTVGTATDSDTLVLLGGSDSTTVNVGETVTLTVNGESYEVTLTGLSDATSGAAAGITVNGDSKTFTEGQTKTVSGIDVYAKTVFRTGDNSGYVEIQLGADKLTFETGGPVQYGSDNEDIEGTHVTWTGGPTAMTVLNIAVAVGDDDFDHFLVKDAFTDPVFGTVKLELSGIANGPVFTEEADTGRSKINIVGSGDRELMIELTDKLGNAGTVPFIYNGALTDDNSKSIHLVEGATIAEDEYFILNSGDNQHFMQLTKAYFTHGSNDDVKIKDVVTGDIYTFDNHNFASGYSATINGQTYTITNQSATSATITSSDYSTVISVFPYLELVSGQDYPRVALTDNDQTVFTAATQASNKTVALPTGNAAVTFAASASADCTTTITPTGGSASTFNNGTTSGVVTVGEGRYVVAVTDTGMVNNSACSATVTFGIDADLAGAGTAAQAYPGLLFVEGEDESEATSDVYNTIFFNMTDDATYSEFGQVTFSLTSGTQYDSQSWDDTDYTGYLTNWGSYVLTDNSNSDQHLVSITYPENQMYATVFLAEESASISTTGGQSTSAYDGQVYLDTETSGYSNKNVIVVGGSCINSAAATLVGGAFCGDAWKEATGAGPGEYIIKGYDTSQVTGKLALLVAGWSAADTVNAATYLKNNAVDTSMAYKGTTATSATAVTSTA